MNRQIIWASLTARPVRTTVGILAVALEVTLILVIVGLTTGMRDETGRRVEGVGGDIMLQPPNSSLFLGLSNTTMPVALGEKIMEIEGVQAVAAVQTLVNSDGGLGLVYGVDPEEFAQVSGGFIWHKGRIFSEPGEIIVDDWFARSNMVDVGDNVPLLNQEFRVAGIVEHGKGARVYMSRDQASELSGMGGRVSLFFVKLHNPDDVYTVIERMGQVFPTYPARAMRDYASLMVSTSMPVMDGFIRAVVFVAVVIGVLVIFLSMYTTITERTREIGILRSLGASKRFIMTLIFQESLTICLTGFGLGLVTSLIVGWTLPVAFPTLTVWITPDWILRASMFALLSGVVGAVYPSLKAAAQDPIEALAYE